MKKAEKNVRKGISLAKIYVVTGRSINTTSHVLIKYLRLQIATAKRKAQKLLVVSDKSSTFANKINCSTLNLVQMNDIIKNDDLRAFIQSKIYVIRGMKVMLDRDLADLYGVETRTLNQKVKRNIRRFQPDFMFQMTKEDIEEWKSQIVISNSIKMGLRKPPYAFTENGVAMLMHIVLRLAKRQSRVPGTVCKA